MRQAPSSRHTESYPPEEQTPESYVYCVGCGRVLGKRSLLLRGRPHPITTYCKECEGRNVDSGGENGPPTYCFRCGAQHVRYIEAEPYRTIHSICPRCWPERAARYARGDFSIVEPAEGQES
jgi:hypothetical protein